MTALATPRPPPHTSSATTPLLAEAAIAPLRPGPRRRLRHRRHDPRRHPAGLARAAVRVDIRAPLLRRASELTAAGRVGNAT